METVKETSITVTLTDAEAALIRDVLRNAEQLIRDELAEDPWDNDQKPEYEHEGRQAAKADQMLALQARLTVEAQQGVTA